MNIVQTYTSAELAPLTGLGFFQYIYCARVTLVFLIVCLFRIDVRCARSFRTPKEWTSTLDLQSSKN